MHNVYEDAVRAAAYAALDFPGTYHLAFRDLPALLAAHARGRRALDFGCGAGRSTRFLARLGFAVVGVDIAPAMLAHARARDPAGDYRLLRSEGLAELPAGAFDLVLSAFAFDNIPTLTERAATCRAIARRLAPDGIFVNLVSTPELYVHEWASFSTRAFPENRTARSGDRVRTVMRDVADPRPVDDVLCTDEDYRRIARGAELALVTCTRPLGRPDEPQPWVSETRVPPWAIYVLGRASG